MPKYKLNTITSVELLKLYKTDPDEVAKELYKMAGEFLKRNKTPASISKEDLIQELLIKAILSLDKFDHTRARFSTYINRVFRNYTISVFRKTNAQKRGTAYEKINLESLITENLQYLDIIEAPGISAEAELLEREFLEDLKGIVSNYTIEYLKGEKQADLAVKYGKTKAWLSQKIARDIMIARKKLRDKWKR